MAKKTVYLVAGARPNFMKLAPLVRAFDRRASEIDFRIVHTGQHYDRGMSDVFFEELGIPEPHFHLGAGGGTHAEQTAKIMLAFEKLCVDTEPDCVLVVGDVNSTLACSIVAKKLKLPVAHVEAGLRSGDRDMPEEINRLVTDAISDWFFVTEPSGMQHLSREGQAEDRLFHVGHVMVDNVLFQRDRLSDAVLDSGPVGSFRSKHAAYGVVTMHRPSNVDNEHNFRAIARALVQVSQELPLAFPVHPRSKANMDKFGIDLGPNVHLMEPQSYMPFLALWKDARLILTDSGGLQEESTALGIPCLTMRENTERPITVDEGSNLVVGCDPDVIVKEARRVLAGNGKQGRRPALWDGNAAERTVEILIRLLASDSTPKV